MNAKNRKHMNQLAEAARALSEVRIRLATAPVTELRNDKGVAQEMANVARSIALQAVSIAIEADIAEGVRERHARGMLKRARKALGYTYP